MSYYREGHRVFGENRVQELERKKPLLPSDIKWHLIGHLQTNKADEAVKLADCIHSLDSERLWNKLNTAAEKQHSTIDCLLQIKVAREESKYGWDYDRLCEFLSIKSYLQMRGVRITGIMGMATLTDDSALIRREMQKIKSHFTQLKATFFYDDPSFAQISMGMSGDYAIALEEGSTMLRVGSILFE